MEFRINYSKVIQQGNGINDLARNLNADIQNLDNFMQQVKVNWKGPASEAYIKQCELLRIEMCSTLRRMQDVSNVIKNTANRIQSEDEAAVERARKLAQNKGGGTSGGGGSSRGF